MKRLIQREIIAVVNQLHEDFNIMYQAEVDKEYAKLTADKLSKSMKKRARLLDAFVYGGEYDDFANRFKSALLTKAHRIVKARVSTFDYHKVYDQVVMSQIDATDLNVLLKDIRTSLNI